MIYLLFSIHTILRNVTQSLSLTLSLSLSVSLFLSLSLSLSLSQLFLIIYNNVPGVCIMYVIYM